MRDFDDNLETGGGIAAKPQPQDTGRPLAATDPKSPTPNLDMLAKGIAVGVTVSVILHTGKQLVGTVAKNPTVVFGLGFALGWFAHRHRKAIIAIADNAAGQGRAFVKRQQATIEELLSDAEENPAP